MDAEQTQAAAPMVRCGRCGEVIGVYEPLVHIVGGIAHKTSRAADPGLRHAAPGSCFHLGCSGVDAAELVTVE